MAASISESHSSESTVTGNQQVDEEKKAVVQTADSSTEDLGSTRRIRGLPWLLVVASVLSSLFIFALDNTIVAVIVPPVVKSLGEVDKLPWLSVGFMMGGVSMVMPFGKLYGLYNAKWLYIGSVTIFLAGSALCGAAPTMNAMIVGRALAGAGGNGMYIGVLTLLSVTTTDNERPAYLGLVGLVWGIGTVLGPVVGGGFAQFDWRWAFYINLIIGGVWLPVYLWLIPSFDPRAGTPLSKRHANFDYLGALLSVAGFVTFIMGLSFGGTVYPWNSATIIALFVVSGVCWIVFFIVQHFNILTDSQSRMFPMHFLKNKEALLLFLLIATGACAAFVSIYYIPIYFQFTRGDSAIHSAVRLLPLVFMLSFFALINGGLLAKFGFYKPWYLVGSALGLIGSVLMYRIDETTSTSKIYGFEVLIGIGTGMYAQTSYAVIQTIVDPSDISYGISFIMIGQLGSLAVSLAMCGSVFLNQAQKSIAAAVPSISHAEIQSLVLGTSGNFLDTLPQDQHDAALQSLVFSLREVFIPVVSATALGLVASLFMRNKRIAAPAAAPA